MARLTPDELIELIETTKNGCDKQCNKCELYFKANEMCYHEVHKRWMKWNEEEHKRFGKVLRGENVE